jgi:hypothetical protein
MILEVTPEQSVAAEPMFYASRACRFHTAAHTEFLR